MNWPTCRRLGFLILLALCLSSCFQADLTLRFDHHVHGQFTQSIYLGERGTALATASLAPWLAARRRQVGRLGGSLRQDAEGIQLTVPFSTGPDLVTRFQQVFAEAEPEPGLPSSQGLLLAPGLGLIPFNLQVEQRNWGLASRTQLIYDLDLRELPTSKLQADRAAPSASASVISFRLQTPWGIRQVSPKSALPTVSLPTEADWLLQPGQLNHIDVLFWLPNAVGLGTVAIVGLVLVGYVLRYRWLSPPRRLS
ncbi:MAG: DUF3153 domain-containing protein [Leptolyngbyaceae cyanobacterium SM2_5_2]|nr:DUF3153 domain-containing protein [Leptolyngbyaceae cyanobacterium SM2_5_2]